MYTSSSVGDIITLFEEDNIFSTGASLTYGPHLQYQSVLFIIEKCKGHL